MEAEKIRHKAAAEKAKQMKMAIEAKNAERHRKMKEAAEEAERIRVEEEARLRFEAAERFAERVRQEEI